MKTGKNAQNPIAKTEIETALPVSKGANGWKISPTDISQFIRLEQCQRYLRLRLYERSAGLDFMYKYGVTPQSIPVLLTRSGETFEKKVEAEVASRYPCRNFATDPAYRSNRTPNNDALIDVINTLRSGDTICLFQVRLIAQIGTWSVRGDIDILRAERDAKSTLHFLIADMKSSTAAKVEHRLQVAFYQAMLATILDERQLPYSEIATGILYRGAANADANPNLTAQEQDVLESQRQAAEAIFGVTDAYLELADDQQAYQESVSDLVTGDNSIAHQVVAAPFETLPFHLSYKCDGCLYNEYCMKWCAERDDLSLLPHLTALDKDALHRAGVANVRELAHLKEFKPTPDSPGGTNNSNNTNTQSTLELIPAPGKENLVRKVAATWPIGPRVDELVHRARRYRRFKKEPIRALTFIPSKGHGSLPYCDANHNPNLVRVYIDAQHDYLDDRIYLLGALVVACENGEENPNRRRTIVRITDGPPDSNAKEEELFVNWIADTISAIVDLSAPDANGEKTAPIHLLFFNRYEQNVLLDGLGRHLSSILGATPMYDFITQLAAFDSPVLTFLDEEIRELKNYPMVCQSLQSVSAYLGFVWQKDGINYRELFKERLFDFWGKLDDTSVQEGESAWFTNRSRFNSQLPLEYAYAAWGELLPPDPNEEDHLARYRSATIPLLKGFQELRLEAIEHIAKDFKGNHLTSKGSFRLPDIATFTQKAKTLAHALQEFLTIERHVELAAWKTTRNSAPERRVLMGETLLVRYNSADQDPEIAAQNADNQHRYELRQQYEAAFKQANPDAARVKLTKEQQDEAKWSHESLQFVLKLETEGTDTSLEQILALSTLREGERVVLYPRYTQDERLPIDQRTDNTPTPKQMLYGARVEIKKIAVERDGDDKPVSASVLIEAADPFGATLGSYVFSSGPGTRPLRNGVLYTLDPDPNDWYGYWCSVVVDALCELESANQASLNTLYARLVAPGQSQVEWSEEASEGQSCFLAGLDALFEAGAFHDLEPGKHEYIGPTHSRDPILMVQGPPGTGKSYATAFAVLARLQGAMAVGEHFRVLLSCKTHAATDVLVENVREAQHKLREKSHTHPEIFNAFFDPRILDVPLYRIAPKQTQSGIIPLAKSGGKGKGEASNADILDVEPWCVIAAPPGRIYDLVKERWTNKNLFGNYLCHCLVLDEASQMNLPEAIMCALPLDPAGQVIVVGDHRQMPPIVKHDWASERRRTFTEYKSYQSLFEHLLELDPPPPIIRFAESFRLHADMAEFLRQEIYSKDGIPYHSEKHKTLHGHAPSNAFAAAVLSPDHPLIVVVHGEDQSQARNPFERRLIVPVLEALADPALYGLDPLSGLGVVVPHRAQRADMQTNLPNLTLLDEHTGAVRYSAVDTVERFQGGERIAIIVSATESDRDYLLAASDFLYDPRRLTVAISRAKEKMVLVASRTIFSLFSPNEDAFENAQLWKNLLRRTCTLKLWEGEFEGKKVEVWGNTPHLMRE